MRFDGSLIDADLTKYTKHITPPFKNIYTLTLKRKVSEETLNNLLFDSVPGFKFKWNYDKNVDAEKLYENNYANLMFAKSVCIPCIPPLLLISRIVNILHTNQDKGNRVWNTRMQYLYNLSETPQCTGLLLNEIDMERNFNKTFNNKLVKFTNDSHNQNITEETFKKAFEIFMDLNFCPPDIVLLFKNVFNITRPRKLLEALTSIRKTALNAEKVVAKNIWHKTVEYLQPLQYNIINYENFTKSEICKTNNITKSRICKDQKTRGNLCSRHLNSFS